MITIGRDERCDLRIPLSYDTVSNFHADIEEEHGKLYFFDHSSNGSIINGQRICNQRVEIRLGDEVKLSNTYTLTWSEIVRYFPNMRFATVPIAENGGAERHSRSTQMYNPPTDYRRESDNWNNREDHGSHGNNNNYIPEDHSASSNLTEIDNARARQGWNWGGFLLGWIWGVGHRCWWPLFVVLGVIFIYPIFCFIFPLLGAVISPIVALSNLIIAIYLGVKGNSIGWENGCYENLEHFHQKERRWTIAGLIVWGLSFLFGLLVIVFFASFLAALV